MRYLALATDYDGTLAHHGQVDEATVDALERLRASGRKVVLVTGRELDELHEVCPRLDLFDRVVAENGALLYRPDDRSETVLGEKPPAGFLEALGRRGVAPVSVGRVIVATWEPYQAAVLDAIRETGLELQVIFNKGAVMVLPPGVNKATGLAAALAELGLSPHNVVGIGDAENDHAFLAYCECSAAVANALPTVQQRSDMVTREDHGRGVAELIGGLLDDDLGSVAPRLSRHQILLGKREDGSEECIPPYGVNILVAGTSGSGKSTMTTGLLERLAEKGYQFVIIDPEGDYATLNVAMPLGTAQREPTAEEVLDLLEVPGQNVVVNLLGVALGHRPAFFDGLMPRLQDLRARTGRPHWLVIDETHHVLPVSWEPAPLTLPRRLTNVLTVTVHPEAVARSVLEAVDLVLAVGESPEKTLDAFCRAVGQEPPETPECHTILAPGETLAWWRGRPGGQPFKIQSETPKFEHNRHLRKYAEGDLGPGRSFRFRGPEGKLNLRAQNLAVFLQLSEGIDDETWAYHLHRGDYSDWFREVIKDQALADEAERVETSADATADTRSAIRAMIARRYTLSSEPAAPSGIVTEED